MSKNTTSNDNKKTLKTASYNMIANVFSLIIGMAMIPIISRVLPQEDLGLATTFIANRNILVIFVTLSIYSYFNRAMIEYEKERIDYSFAVVFFCFISILIFFLICLPIREFVQSLLSLNDFLYTWLFISMFCFAVYSITNYYCIFHNKSKLVFFIVLTVGPISQILSIILALVMTSDKYIGRIIGLDAMYVIITLFFSAWLISKGFRKIKTAYIKESLFFSIPLIPHLLSQNVLTQCDLIMITYFVGADKTGIYSMGHTIGFLAFTVMSQILAAWSPWVYRRLKNKECSSIKKNSTLMILMGFYLSVGLMSISPELVTLFLPDSYREAIYIIPPLVTAMFFQYLYIFFYDLQYYFKKTHLIALCSIIAAAINFVLNILLIPTIGYISACYTTMIGYFALFLLNLIFTIKYRPKEIYDLKAMVSCSLFLIVYMMIMMFFADNIFARYFALIVLTIFFLVRKGSDILSIIKALRQ